MAKNMLKPFWIVWTDDGDAAEDFVKHDSFQAAYERAMEIAEEYKATTYVLKTVGGYILNEPQWESFMDAVGQ